MRYDRAVYIGRFQPLHNGHLSAINKALAIAKQVVVLVGSARSPRTVKNPFTYHERAAMLKEHFGNDIVVMPLRDYKYDDTQWIKEVHAQVTEATYNGEGSSSIAALHGYKTAILGLDKDESTYYLHHFPNWKLVENHHDGNLDATSIRDLYLDRAPMQFIQGVVPTQVYSFLQRFQDSEDYHKLADEKRFLFEYKHKYPTTTAHCTADAVVVQSGHVLLVRRGQDPGEGLWALPGGFLGRTETHFQSAVRELYEETCIKIQRKIMERALVSHRTFDDPGRDLRGRTVTRAFLFKLDDAEKLPKVKGADDAAEARWFTLAELDGMEPVMYSDHWHIIRNILGEL